MCKKFEITGLHLWSAYILGEGTLASKLFVIVPMKKNSGNELLEQYNIFGLMRHQSKSRRKYLEDILEH